MKVLLLLTIILLVGCTSRPAPTLGVELTFTEVYPDKGTALVKQHIIHLTQIYDLSPLLFTKKIEIESRRIPSHSKPVLTLNTRFSEQPHKILAVFIHEQLHWWADNNKLATAKAIAELRRKFPSAPLEGRLTNRLSVYEHPIVCLLEFDALSFYLVKKKAMRLFLDIKNRDKIYPWTYTQVLTNYSVINNIILKYQLKPKFLMPVRKPIKKSPLQKPTKKPLPSPAKRLKNL